VPPTDQPRHRLVRSPDRRRSASAAVRGGELVLRVPAGLAPDDERELAGRVLAKVVRRADDAAVPAGPPPSVPARDTRARPGPRGDRLLVARADAVADRFLGGVRATRVSWSHRMQSRWGSCTVPSARVRISSRVSVAPDEVLDHLLLHELAHLRETGHGTAFRRLVAQDPAGPAADAWFHHLEVHTLRRALGRSDA